jgi:hypothetical protein
VRDIGVGGGDIPDATHIGGGIVNMVNPSASSLQTVIELAEVQQFELIGGARLILRFLEVHAADPMSVRRGTFEQMVTNETTGTGNKYPATLRCVKKAA